ncbi:MAG: phage ORF5 protein [Candidatus Spyradenecus sp.]
MEQTDGILAYYIKDKKMGLPTPFFFAKNDEEACTIVARSLLSPDGKPSHLALFPADFCLVFVGVFHSSTGRMDIVPESGHIVKELTELVSSVVTVSKSVSRSANSFLAALDKKGED